MMYIDVGLKSISLTFSVEKSFYTHALRFSSEIHSLCVCDPYQYTSFDAEFYACSEFEVKIDVQPTHSRENRVLKFCVGELRSKTIFLKFA